MALWGGRFNQPQADSVFALSRSVHFDWRLAPYDLVSSLAHLFVLEQSGVLNRETSQTIRTGLKSLFAAVRSGKFSPIATDEDVHSALERGLVEKIGTVAGSIRAGRSRNDQVATDFKLYLIDHMLEIAAEVSKLHDCFVAKASEYVDDIAPGFTHLQHAQPVSFGHELAKHAHAFDRDLSRIHDWHKRASLSPLGAGALSGTSLPISPERTAQILGFSGVVANSIDAVSDRDYVAEALFVIALIGVHLSRIGEEWTLWSTSEFGWAKISDAYSTGSSMMPQKKNPDVAELARGKSGRFIGNLTGLLVVLKGLPFAYNRDLQEDKEMVFDSIENMLLILPPVAGMVAATVFDREKMRAAAPLGFSLATEIADYLVGKGIPFADAHEAAGACVKFCEKNTIDLHEISERDFAAIHPELDSGVFPFLQIDGAVAARKSSNGTAPASVRAQLEALSIKSLVAKKWISSERAAFSGMMSL